MAIQGIGSGLLCGTSADRRARGIRRGGYPQSLVYMAAFGSQAAEVGFVLLDELRRAGIAADMDFRASSLKAHLRQADRLGVLYAILLGEDEAAKGSVTIRNMHTKEQEDISVSALPSVLLSRLTGQT